MDRRWDEGLINKSITVSTTHQNIDVSVVEARPEIIRLSVVINKLDESEVRKYLKKYFRYLGEFRYELA